MKSLSVNQLYLDPTESHFVDHLNLLSTGKELLRFRKQAGKFIDQQKTVILPITNHTIIADIQQKFQERFPYLNLNFFKVDSHTHSSSTKKFCRPSNHLGAELKLKKEGEFTIKDTMTVAQLADAIYQEFGIHTQVFRKSVNLWMEITLTTNWTLEQQNNHGREISIQ